MKHLMRWNIFFILSVWCALAGMSFQTASAAELPYEFRVEWMRLTDQEGKALTPPVDAATVAVLWLLPKEGYHTYAHDPGDGAMPTRIEAPGADVRYLPGVPQADVFEPDMTVRVYDGPTPVFLVFAQDPTPANVEASVSMLACSSQNCFPVTTTVPLGVPPESAPASSTERPVWLNDLFRARSDEAGAMTTPTEKASSVAFSSGAAKENLNAGQPFAPIATMSDGESLISVGTDDSWNFGPRPLQASLEVQGLGKALLFGLLAGLILNVMPCVLPVLTLKISTLLAAEGEEKERKRAFREHNILFSAGILTWFAALALLFGLAGMAWGQLFQNSAVVFVMLLLVFALGLSMFDVFHLPVLDLRVGGSHANPRLNAYSTGLLATLLATPCSGPLLGGVLGWSLMQSLPVLMTVFLATGLGMALPYLLMAWKPSLANALPRPGNWMLTFERVLGFFLMGTALYLLSILPASMQVPALAVLLVAAAAAWVWGRWGSLRGTLLRRLLIGAGGLAAVGFSMYLSFAPAAPGVTWQPFRPDTFRSMLGKKPLLVEFTADWCPTCKVLERTTLTADNLKSLVERYDVTLVRVDLTRNDAQAQALLRALDSASIPLLAVFPEGDAWGKPVVLRDIYTAGQMEEAVRQALRP